MQEAKNEDHPGNGAAGIGDYIRQARLAKGISVRQFAATIRMDHSYVSRLESGAFKQPSPEKLHRIATALDLDYSHLFSLAGYKTDQLPSLASYLRTKYRMDDHVAQKLSDYFDQLKKQYRIEERLSESELSGLEPEEIRPENIKWEDL